MKKSLLSILSLFIFSCAELPSKPIQKIEVSTQQDDYRKAVRPYFSLFRDCYSPIYEKNPQVQGDMTFAWEVHQGGVAKNITSVPSPTSLKNEVLEYCMLGVISRIKFPNPPPNTILLVKDYFFRFAGKDNKTFIEATF